MYKTKKLYSRKLKAMRDAKEQKRLEKTSSESMCYELPELRRSIVIIDRDFGLVAHKIDLYKTNRIDCFDMHVDGQLKYKRIGFSKVLEKIRLNFPRVQLHA